MLKVGKGPLPGAFNNLENNSNVHATALFNGLGDSAA